MATDPLSKMNREIREWAKDTTGELRKKFAVLNIQHVERSPNKTASREALENRFGMMQGAVSRIAFKFPKSMVFVAKGVGKGVPAAIAGTSATSRVPKDWFNKTVDESIEALAEIAANGQGDLVCDNLHIR